MITKYIILCGCEPENTNPKDAEKFNREVFHCA